MPLPGLAPQNIRLPGLPDAAIPMAPDVIIEADDGPAPELNDNEPVLRIEHDDLVDTVSMALRHLRETGLLVRAPERMAEIDAGRRHVGKEPAPLYPI